MERTATVLVVDDVADNIMIISNVLKGEFRVKAARSARQALAIVSDAPPDLILLDVMMPEVDGYELLRRLKSSPETSQIPVIYLTARDDDKSEELGFSLGAVDYVRKPIVPATLLSRVRAQLMLSLQRRQLQEEKEANQALLLNMLPRRIVDRLNNGETEIADQLDDITVLFADLVGFTSAADRLAAADIVEDINRIFLAFDELTDKHGVEKIKTIGDCYMAVSNLEADAIEGTVSMVDYSLGMLRALDELRDSLIYPFEVRIGLHSGPAVAGVLTGKRSAFDVWGDTVNIASRFESTGSIGRVHVSEVVARRVETIYRVEVRGLIDIKGKGMMESFLIEHPHNQDS